VGVKFRDDESIIIADVKADLLANPLKYELFFVRGAQLHIGHLH